MESRFELIHSSPSELRVTGLDLWGITPLCSRIQTALADIPSVLAVSANPVTGSITVEHEPDSAALVVDAVRKQLPSDATLEERDEARALTAAGQSAPAVPVPGRLSRDEAKARAAIKRRFSFGVAAAAFVAGFVARHLFSRR